MKQFSMFIAEVWALQDTSKSAGLKRMSHAHIVTGSHRENPEAEGFKHIGTHPETGHHIWHYKHGNQHEYHFHDPKEHGKVDLAVATSSKGTHRNGYSTHTVNSIVSREGSSIKAHQAYAHLIKKHKLILRTYAQTPGSREVWKKLAADKGVSVHGWHNRRSAVNVKPHKSGEDDEDIYHTLGAQKKDDERREGRPHSLVASKKPRS